MANDDISDKDAELYLDEIERFYLRQPATTDVSPAVHNGLIYGLLRRLILERKRNQAIEDFNTNYGDA